MDCVGDEVLISRGEKANGEGMLAFVSADFAGVVKGRRSAVGVQKLGHVMSRFVCGFDGLLCHVTQMESTEIVK